MIDLGGHLGGPGGIFKPLPEAERRAIVGLYDGEVGYTDEALVGALIRSSRPWASTTTRSSS